MNSDKRQLAGVPVLAALTGLLVMVVFAGPASADGHKSAQKHSPSRTSGGCVAVNGSVCSGESFAADDSTASGASTAIDDSVASGGLPDRDKDGKKPEGKRPEGKRPEGKRPTVGGTGGDVPTAGPAEARRVSSLAFTGPRVGPELALATGLLLAGALLLGLGSERRRSVPSS